MAATKTTNWASITRKTVVKRTRVVAEANIRVEAETMVIDIVAVVCTVVVDTITS